MSESRPELTNQSEHIRAVLSETRFADPGNFGKCREIAGPTTGDFTQLPVRENDITRRAGCLGTLIAPQSQGIVERTVIVIERFPGILIAWRLPPHIEY